MFGNLEKIWSTTYAMFTATIQALTPQQIQNYIDIVKHCLNWIACKNEDRILENPAYDSTTPEAERTNIYVIPGTADFPGGLQEIMTYINSLKLPSNVQKICIVALGHRFEGRSIEEFAKELDEKMQGDGAVKSILIGHSRGGLIATKLHHLRYLSPSKDRPSPIAVFTIGSPFRGSELANDLLAWLSKSVKEMQVGSEFLEEITTFVQQCLTNEENTIYKFYVAKNDWIVKPTASVEKYVQEKPDAEITITNETHLSVAHSLVMGRSMHNEILLALSPNQEKSKKLDDAMSLIEDYEYTPKAQAATLLDIQEDYQPNRPV